MSPEEIEAAEILSKIAAERKKRTLIGAALLSLSLLLMQIAILILIGVLEFGVTTAVVLIFASPIILAVGIYLMVHAPPIILE